MKIKKFFAKLFVIVSAFFVVLSPVVSVVESTHHCNHEECQICEVIRTTKETINHTKTPNPVSVVVFLLPALFLFIAVIAYTCKNIDFSTLVSLKTKLSN